MAPRETENNAYAKFWGDKQRTLWYVMVFSGVVNWFCMFLSIVLMESMPMMPFQQEHTINKSNFQPQN